MKNLLAWLDVHFEDALCGVLLVGIMIMLADLLWLGFNATVIYQGALLIDSMSTRPMVSGSMLLDLRYVYFAVPAAFTLQSFRILQRWYRHFRGGVSILGQQQEEV